MRTGTTAKQTLLAAACTGLLAMLRPLGASICYADRMASWNIIELMDAAQGWYTAADANAPGAQQSVIVNEGEHCLHWEVLTNADGKFTGYQMQKDGRWDLSDYERFSWKWKAEGTYLQIQFWSGDGKFMYFDSSKLSPRQWGQVCAFKEEFHKIGDFKDEDWRSITRIGFRIADSFASYAEGQRYAFDLAAIRGQRTVTLTVSEEALSRYRLASKEVLLEEDEQTLTLSSKAYRLRLGKRSFQCQLWLAGPEGRYQSLTSDSLWWGYDSPKGGVGVGGGPLTYEVVKRDPQQVVLTFGVNLGKPVKVSAVLTFYCFGNRFYTAARYRMPLDLALTNTRLAPSGDVRKDAFEQYAFRDERGRLRRGAVADHAIRSGLGKAIWETQGDLVQAFPEDKPYLYFYSPSQANGLAVVYMDYQPRWKPLIEHAYLCVWEPERNHFHLGLASGGDVSHDFVCCFYADNAADVALVDQVVVPAILQEAATMRVAAIAPRGFTPEVLKPEELLPKGAKLHHVWGNHMHWIGVGWGPEGDRVIPASTKDTLDLIDGSGAVGAINFDMVGIERMAKSDPQVTARLKEYLARGKVDLVGATYGQPLGNFQGGESNIRQLVWGQRVCKGVLGFTPKTWWEEEFYYFPQLPQLLRGCGFDSACLYFQRTWMQPSMPIEAAPAVRWRALDGTEIPALSHTALCGWMPNNLAPLRFLDNAALGSSKTPVLTEWTELLPLNNWGCRGENYNKRFRALHSIGAKPVTASQYLRQTEGQVESRTYDMDQTFHGLSIGKNGDRIRQLSKLAENQLVTAETFAAVASLASNGGQKTAKAEAWKSQTEEAWRNLLIAQGHDVDICEGAVGDKGVQHYQRSLELSRPVLEGALGDLASRVDTRRPSSVPGTAAIIVFNALSWMRDDVVEVETKPPQGRDLQSFALLDADGKPIQFQCQPTPDGKVRVVFVARGVPSLGYATYWLTPGAESAADSDLQASPDGEQIENSSLLLVLDRTTGAVKRLYSKVLKRDLLAPGTFANSFQAVLGGAKVSSLQTSGAPSLRVAERGAGRCTVEASGHLTAALTFSTRVKLYAQLPRADIETDYVIGQRLDGLIMGSLTTSITPSFDCALFHDHPFAVTGAKAENAFSKSYPDGTQETVRNHFTALNFVDLAAGDFGLEFIHSGNQGFLRDGTTVKNILSMYDPWDQGRWEQKQCFRYALHPHGKYRHSDRLRRALEFNNPLRALAITPHPGPMPPRLSLLSLQPDKALLSSFACEAQQRVLLRTYEVDGRDATVRLQTRWKIGEAKKTNLLGRLVSPLPARTNEVTLRLRPHEVATVWLRFS